MGLDRRTVDHYLQTLFNPTENSVLIHLLTF